MYAVYNNCRWVMLQAEDVDIIVYLVGLFIIALFIELLFFCWIAGQMTIEVNSETLTVLHYLNYHGRYHYAGFFTA